MQSPRFSCQFTSRHLSVCTFKCVRVCVWVCACVGVRAPAYSQQKLLGAYVRFFRLFERKMYRAFGRAFSLSLHLPISIGRIPKLNLPQRITFFFFLQEQPICEYSTLRGECKTYRWFRAWFFSHNQSEVFGFQSRLQFGCHKKQTR